MSAVKHWRIQRYSAIAMIPLSLWLMWVLETIPSFEAEHLHDRISQPVNAVLLLLAIVIALYHGSLGMEVILEDYVHHPARRKRVIRLIRLLLVAVLLLLFFSVARVVF